MNEPDEAEGGPKKKRPRKSIFRLLSDSTSDEDSSSSSSDDEWPPKVPQLPAVASRTTPKAPALPQTHEDEFDLSVLSLSGSWMSSSTNVEEPPLKELPVRFESAESYTASFKPLVLRECRAMLTSKREEEKGNAVECKLSVSAEEGGHFRYIEAKFVSSLDVEVGQVVVVEKSGSAKTIALVTFLLRPSKSAVLSAPSSCTFPSGQYELRALDNLTTVKRSFIAMSSLSNFSNPIRQQILDPKADPPAWLHDPPKIEAAVSEWSSWHERTNFNRQQLLAIIAVARMQEGFFLVQGPPGTGKTTTIIGMVSAFLNENPTAKILLCAPSNAALDEACERLLKGMYKKDGTAYVPAKGSVLRTGRRSGISSACYGATVEGLLAGQRLSRSFQEEERSLYTRASVICSTLSSCGHWLMEELKMTFDLVIVDEAVQAVETEILIALRRAKSRCVLIGDPCQLPATVFQQPEAPYSRSLFERLQAACIEPHFLDTQYRMHEAISRFPSRRFYGGALLNSPQVLEIGQVFKQEDVCSEGYFFKVGHYSFLNVDFGVDVADDNMSRFNTDEAKAVASIIRGIFRSLINGIKLEVGVVTPYASQRKLIRKYLTDAEQGCCEINTIDGFQGREKDIILVSCVRAQQGGGLGFVSDTRRMNVALTRAKYAVFIVGHAQTLENESSDWKDLIQDARERGVFQDVIRQQFQGKKVKAKPRKKKAKV